MTSSELDEPRDFQLELGRALLDKNRLSSELAASRERERDLEREITRYERHVEDLTAEATKESDGREAAEAEVKRLRAALEPFVAAFEERRAKYARRHADLSLGYANFDKMPDQWPMEKITFSMLVFRRARRALADANTQGGDNAAD